MTSRTPTLFGDESTGEGLTLARNLSTRYLAIAAEIALGLVTLPFNVSHLGKAAYGLWALTSSVTAYFSVLDLGYSGALVKFVAQYRTKRDARALNEILSTVFFVFAACGALMYAVAIVLAVYLDRVFNIPADQVTAGRIVLLVTSVNVAGGIVFSVFGAVINGFLRYDLNNLVGTVSGIITAIVNLVVLWLGFGLVGVVVSVTTVRVLTYWVYRANAYRVFPGLRIRPALFTRERLRETTVFSMHMAVIDWANKMNYSMDAIVIGAFLNTTAVAVWAIGQRLAELVQRLANQLNDILFPSIVAHDTAARADRLQLIFVQGTRLSLAAAVPLGGAMALLAERLVRAWVGPDFGGSVAVLQLLSVIVIVRVGAAMAGTLLKGAGDHRLVASTNMAAALLNVALSVALVRPLGLVGVALGTLIPVCLSLIFIIFPAGCRRVGLTVPQALARAVWPAVWPGAVMAAWILATMSMIPDRLLAVGAAYCTAVLIYIATFLLVGVSAVDRQLYVGKMVEATRRTVFRLAPEGA